MDSDSVFSLVGELSGSFFAILIGMISLIPPLIDFLRDRSGTEIGGQIQLAQVKASLAALSVGVAGFAALTVLSVLGLVCKEIPFLLPALVVLFFILVTAVTFFGMRIAAQLRRLL